MQMKCDPYQKASRSTEAGLDLCLVMEQPSQGYRQSPGMVILKFSEFCNSKNLRARWVSASCPNYPPRGSRPPAT